MKVGITGHTKGIGKEISNYFLKNNYKVIGFARSNGYDISKEFDRNKILEESKELNIFVNNAYNNFDNSQETLLKDLIDLWKDQSKIIINISSRWDHSNHPYSKSKKSIDDLCSRHSNSNLYIVNLKPGLVDTTRVKNIVGNKMSVESVSEVIDFILKNLNNFRVHSITFGKI